LRSASIASGRGKLRRQASATRREGTGFAKGRMRIRSPPPGAPTEVDGSTVMPTPPATIWRMVSSEPPSTVRAIGLRGAPLLSLCLTVWQNSSTWSRKQCPSPSRSSASRVSSSELTRLRPSHGWPFGTATTKGSSYTARVSMPGSSNGSAIRMTSTSPCFSISASRWVKFSWMCSCIDGALRRRIGISFGRRYGPMV
jgi:hypothetical protein